MKIIRNEKLIKRNGKIGQILSGAGLIGLVVAIYLSLQFMKIDSPPSNLQFYGFVATFILGMIFTQIGNYLGLRYGRSPRLDQRLDAALKGLPGEFNLYHYTSPATHLLLGPAGMWVLLPYQQRGTIAYEKNRWRVRGGGFLQSYMRFFGGEALGRPELDAKAEIDSLQKYFDKHLDGAELPEIQTAVVFTDDHTVIAAADAPIPTLSLKKLKDMIRQQAKDAPMAKLEYDRLKALLPQE